MCTAAFNFVLLGDGAESYWLESQYGLKHSILLLHSNWERVLRKQFMPILDFYDLFQFLLCMYSLNSMKPYIFIFVCEVTNEYHCENFS